MNHAALANALVRLAEEEFNPDTVTPGIAGFIMTGVLAVGVILLGVNMVRRIRRNDYRDIVREEIAQELEDRNVRAAGGGGAASQAEGSASGNDAADDESTRDKSTGDDDGDARDVRPDSGA